MSVRNPAVTPIPAADGSTTQLWLQIVGVDAGEYAFQAKTIVGETQRLAPAVARDPTTGDILVVELLDGHATFVTLALSEGSFAQKATLSPPGFDINVDRLTFIDSEHLYAADVAHATAGIVDLATGQFDKLPTAVTFNENTNARALDWACGAVARKPE
jgi:hypothetical protein